MNAPWQNMIVDAASSKLPFELLPSQRELLQELENFLYAGSDRSVFVLNGYAGTGKTSVVGAFIKALAEVKRPVVVLAPTGRAAKVAAGFSGHNASTIHKRIYRGDSTDPSNTQFFLAPNQQRDTLFIVDEASLINDTPGSGRSLLSHLVHHVYSAPGCRMLLIGDEAQLPPVGQTSGTAMNFDRLRSLGLDPVGYTLDVPVRQAAESGIIHNANYIRGLLMNPESGAPAELDLRYPDVEAISSRELDEYLAASWSKVGQEETLIITRSNKRANEFNQAIRRLVMYAEEPIERGDRLVISKNDYFWSKRNELKSFIANGDTAEVTWVGKTEKAYGRYFTEVELKLISDNSYLTAKVMLRSLVCDGPSIPKAEMERFYDHVTSTFKGEASEKIKGAMEDPYFNALQAKYAYCVTCHKAQGGQWKHVYIDMGGIAPDILDSDFYRWLYTAITRSTEKLFFINPTIKTII